LQAETDPSSDLLVMRPRPLAATTYATRPDSSATEGLFAELLIERGAFAWNKGFLDLMPTAVFVCDVDGQLTCFNDKAVELWGRTPALFDPRERYTGAYRLRWPGGRPMDAQEVPMASVIRTGERFENGEVILERPDGTQLFVQYNARPLKSPNGTLLGAISAFEDVSELRQAHADRDRLVAELERALTVRDEFLSIASHELKTPLTTLNIQVDGFLRELKTDGQTVLSTDKVERVARRLRAQILRLSRLVDDLLEVSELSTDRLELELEPVNVGSVVMQVVERFTDRARQRHSPIRVHLEAHVMARADASGLDQVLTNLLDNALKYGEGKPVDVSVGQSGETATVTVTDLGIGIAPPDQERIFERFERAVSERHYGGLGLGLWICRNLMEGMNGRIEVQSEHGKGATFLLKLPLMEQ